jgi:hypothetical protein
MQIVPYAQNHVCHVRMRVHCVLICDHAGLMCHGGASTLVASQVLDHQVGSAGTSLAMLQAPYVSSAGGVFQGTVQGLGMGITAPALGDTHGQALAAGAHMCWGAA